MSGPTVEDIKAKLAGVVAARRAEAAKGTPESAEAVAVADGVIDRLLERLTRLLKETPDDAPARHRLDG